MAKTKTFDKRRGFSMKGLTRFKVDSKLMADPKVTRDALVDALVHNDLDAFRDVLISYVRATSKSALAKKACLGRQTLYDLMDNKKEFNPTLKTVGAILETLAA